MSVIEVYDQSRAVCQSTCVLFLNDPSLYLIFGVHSICSLFFCVLVHLHSNMCWNIFHRISKMFGKWFLGSIILHHQSLLIIDQKS